MPSAAGSPLLPSPEQEGRPEITPLTKKAPQLRAYIGRWDGRAAGS
jgi:hypothetical protein